MRLEKRFLFVGCCVFLIALQMTTDSSQLKTIVAEKLQETTTMWNRTQNASTMTSYLSAEDKALAANVSIIITSSLIPMHPDITYINDTIYSLQYLQGLPHSTPIFITIDGIPLGRKQSSVPQDKRDRLAEYTKRLQESRFPPFTNVTILPSEEHLHIAGSVNMALQHVRTHFVYILQHDLAFRRAVDHPRLVRAMWDHPDLLRNIRFRLKTGYSNHTWPLCNNHSGDWELGGLKFFPTATWSDNNQLSTKAYYEEALAFIKMLKRPMEFPMQIAADLNCSLYGQQVYGARFVHWVSLVHLDGKGSKSISESSTTPELPTRVNINSTDGKAIGDSWTSSSGVNLQSNSSDPDFPVVAADALADIL